MSTEPKGKQIFMRSATIDIGYNAIRAVVYECDKLGAPEIFNDKFKSDIINLLNLSNLEIPHQSYLVLQYGPVLR
ncbi:hypothetical protein [Candidatus Tisiphia endosymbiont of Nemotelus uliginosus]|uniref:hypothetical protein n=1 Tax=Candidatus Tisiphia endosymbiont of Nemotelus uliginosus TaxID=3077926 RepID=UPI0035C904EB